MSSRLVGIFKSGLLALVGLIFGAFMVAFAREPVEQTIVPRAMAMMDHRQVLQIFKVDPAGTVTSAEAEYSVYDSGAGNEVRGRVIRRVAGKDKTDEQSYIVGAKRDDVVTFSYRSVRADKTGVGSFLGKFDPVAEVHVGEVIGYARDNAGDDCRVMRFVAVLGSEKHTARFLDVARAAASQAPRMSAVGGSTSCRSHTASAAAQ